jgi:hypothetical protein
MSRGDWEGQGLGFPANLHGRDSAEMSCGTECATVEQ